MDAAQKKALFRAKLNAQKKDKRINSPLVRYNESDQPVCRVCNLVLKSEALWDAHQASRKHKEAIDKFKASAATLKSVETPKPKEEDKPVSIIHSNSTSPSPLPSNFFDSQPAKKQKTESEQPSNLNKNEPSISGVHMPKALIPAGFFDNKDADLRARGIKLVKVDAKEEYKEFEKSIQEDLKEVDDRLEEEEIDAAEMIEEAETYEQKAYREKVEALKKKKMEVMAAKKSNKKRDFTEIHESSSSDDDDGDSVSKKVDWRAQHL